MAVIKQIETEYGIACEYHKIAVTNVNWHERIASIEYQSYINKDARLAEKSPIKEDSLFIDSGSFNYVYDENIVKKSYEHLKLLAEFIGAVDDI